MSEQATREEKEALAEKIETFASGLSDREADLFAAIVAPPDALEETSGFAASFASPASQLIDMRLGSTKIGAGYRQYLIGKPSQPAVNEPHPIWGK